MAEEEQGYAKLKTGACFLPKANKDKPLGEDAYFIGNDEQTIGVAGGVAGYGNIDSGVYARELMKKASEYVNKGVVDPKTVLNHAYENSRARGASAACIITVRDNTLHAVNIGDSGFMVIRGGEIVCRSRVHQKHFNCPFQLGRFSWSDIAEEMTFKVKHRDVIVVATDGLFDNLFDFMVRDMVQWRFFVEGGQLDDAATDLGYAARSMSLESHCLSPFTMEAIQSGLDYSGGRYDDITVIVGYINQSRSSTTRPCLIPHSSTPPVPAHSYTMAAALVSCLFLNFITRYLWGW